MNSKKTVKGKSLNQNLTRFSYCSVKRVKKHHVIAMRAEFPINKPCEAKIFMWLSNIVKYIIIHNYYLYQ